MSESTTACCVCLPALPQVTQALPLVLLHCQDASCPQLVCSLLQVSTAVNRAVQQSGAQCSISVMECWSLARVSNFAWWLTKHSGLVGAISCCRPANAAEGAWVMTMALEACAERAAATAALAAGAANTTAIPTGTSCQESRRALTHPIQDRLPPPPLRLVFVQTDLATTAVLQLLPLIGVEHLLLQRVETEQVTPRFCCAVAQLHTLKRLNLRMGTWLPERVAVPLELAEAVGALTNLTNLDIVLPTTAVQRLPPCLQQLYLVLTAEQGGQEGAQATRELRHLTALNNLTLHCPRQVTLKAQLPAQLTRLQSFHCAVASGSSGLQKVEVTGPVTSWPRLLRSLRCSTQLSELTVSVVGCGHTWQGQEDVVSLVDAMSCSSCQQRPLCAGCRLWHLMLS